MKKTVCMLLAICMVFSLCACGAQPEAPATPEPVKEWTRAGYFTDENENMLSVTWMEDVDEPGWYIGVMIGELMAGGTLPQEGNTLRGKLSTLEEGAEPITVTVSEEGEDGLLLEIEGGESYHFKPYDMPEATIIVNINTEGMGNIDWTEGEEAPEIDTEYPYQSAYIGLAEPKVHSFVAWPQAGSVFVKWTKNGEDFSTEPQITLLLDESADYVAVFEEDPDWQNPVMNFIGEYQCDRAHALVECFSYDEAWITIEWGGSAWEFARWTIVGRLDTDTLSIAYEGCNKSVVTVSESGGRLHGRHRHHHLPRRRDLPLARGSVRIRGRYAVRVGPGDPGRCQRGRRALRGGHHPRGHGRDGAVRTYRKPDPRLRDGLRL